jgi:hypothetical protein
MACWICLEQSQVKTILNEKQKQAVQRELDKLDMTFYEFLKKSCLKLVDEPEKVRGLILASWFFAMMYCTQAAFLVLVWMS